MSRLRKGRKYKGSGFSSAFKDMVKGGNSPFAVAIGSNVNEEEDTTQSVEDPNSADAANAAKTDKDIVPSDTDYSREEVDSYFQRRKLAKEKAALEKAKADKEAEEKAKEEEEAEIAEEERENLSQGENIAGSYDDDFDHTMSGKERRQESRENKGQIRDAKKEAKAAAKDEFKNKKQAIKDAGLKGKEKRDAKKDARKDKRDDKKSIRQNKRAAKKANRKSKKKARKNK
jgi:hypothetical protein